MGPSSSCLAAWSTRPHAVVWAGGRLQTHNENNGDRHSLTRSSHAEGTTVLAHLMFLLGVRFIQTCNGSWERTIYPQGLQELWGKGRKRAGSASQWGSGEEDPEEEEEALPTISCKFCLGHRLNDSQGIFLKNRFSTFGLTTMLRRRKSGLFTCVFTHNEHDKWR